METVIRRLKQRDTKRLGANATRSTTGTRTPASLLFRADDDLTRSSALPLARACFYRFGDLHRRSRGETQKDIGRMKLYVISYGDYWEGANHPRS